MRFHIGYILGFSAVILAVCAAYFSVFGLAKLFAGATISVIIMASSLELTKVVLASYLHGYWNKINQFLRIYLTGGVIILACITSLGIYGYLTSAYQETATMMAAHDSKIKVFDDQIALYQKQLESADKMITQKEKMIETSMSIRDVQEQRLNDKNTNANRRMATTTENNIAKLSSEVNNLSNDKMSISDSITKLTQGKYKVESESDLAGEIGPLKYIAKITGKDPDYVVNIFILLFIIVFDPLAIALVVATTSVFKEKLIEKNQKISERSIINPKTNSETDSDFRDDKIKSEVNEVVQSVPETSETKKTTKKEDNTNKELKTELKEGVTSSGDEKGDIPPKTSENVEVVYQTYTPPKERQQRSTPKRGFLGMK